MPGQNLAPPMNRSGCKFLPKFVMSDLSTARSDQLSCGAEAWLAGLVLSMRNLAIWTNIDMAVPAHCLAVDCVSHATLNHESPTLAMKLCNVDVVVVVVVVVAVVAVNLQIKLC